MGKKKLVTSDATEARASVGLATLARLQMETHSERQSSTTSCLSLARVIKTFHDGVTRFGQIPDEDWNIYGGEAAVIESTYGAPLRLLQHWDQAATSYEEAVSALRLAQQELQEFTNEPVAGCMVAAALGYFGKGTPAQLDLGLAATIAAYREGIDKIDAIPEELITRENEDALVEATYGAHMRRLMEWDQPAQTLEEAIDALRLMGTEDVFLDKIGNTLHRAVLGFFEGTQLVERQAAVTDPEMVPTDMTAPEWALLKAIHTYKGQWNNYLAQSLDDDKTPEFYMGSLNVLKAWNSPARNICEALAALELALEEYEVGDSEIIPVMVKATLGWLKVSRKGDEASGRRTALNWATVVSSMPTAVGAPAPTEIDLMVQRHWEYLGGWMATADANGDIEAIGPEHDRAWASCKDIVRYQCQTPEEAQKKVQIILHDDWLRETAEAGIDEENFWFRDFLETLLPQAV